MDTTNTCRNFQPQLDAFHDGELSGTEKEAVERHLQGCSACVGKLAEIDRVVHTLKTMPRPQVSSSLAAKLDSIAESGANKVTPLRPRVWLPLAAAAAAVALFIGLRATSPTVGPSTASQPPTQQATQPELAAQPRMPSPAMPPAQQQRPDVKVAQSDNSQAKIEKAPVVAQRPSAPLAVHSTTASANQSRSGDNTKMIANAANGQPDDELAELPAAGQGFNDALGFATDEDGLYDIKM